MPESASLRRIGLAVHPSRDLDRALATVREWALARGVALVQIDGDNHERRVADPGAAGDCDLILALGGDGTALGALHAAASAGQPPVLGVACGSLGVLTATAARALDGVLDDLAAGRWTRRRIPAATFRGDHGPEEIALNDLAVLRDGAGQIVLSVHVDGELYARFSGDGLLIATPLGSSAYTLAAGGPLLAPGAEGLVVTPLANHGGCIPPLVTGPQSAVAVTVDHGHGGARLELDGRVAGAAPAELHATWRADQATLVELERPASLLEGLRRRRIIADSPRVDARDRRGPGVSESTGR